MLRTLFVCLLLACVARAESIAIRVVNSAGVDKAVLAESEQQAARVLHRAGIDVTWRDCTRACPAALAPAEYWMHIVLWKPADASAEELAFTANDVAGVYYPMVRQLAESFALDEAPIIAAALAHEIGHLLGMPHSPVGIMSPVFDRARLVAMSQGGLRFEARF